jgi:putative transposase
MLRRALSEHFHQERNHQGLGNMLIMPRQGSDCRDGPVVRHLWLGGPLNFYDRATA